MPCIVSSLSLVTNSRPLLLVGIPRILREDWKSAQTCIGRTSADWWKKRQSFLSPSISFVACIIDLGWYRCMWATWTLAGARFATVPPVTWRAAVGHQQRLLTNLQKHYGQNCSLPLIDHTVELTDRHIRYWWPRYKFLLSQHRRGGKC